MKREIILKVIFVLIMGVILFAMPANVFATSSGAADLTDLWEDQGGLEDLQGQEQKPTTEQTPSTEPTPTPTPEPEKETKPSTETPKKEEELPKAGLAEDTMMVVSIIVLGTIAVFAFKKVNEYNNI